MENSGASYYGFKQKPFNRRPDPRFVYRNPGAKQAYTEIVAGLRNQASLIVLTGAADSGKATLSRLLTRELACDAHFVTFTEIPSTFDGALSHICKSLGLNITDVEHAQLLPLLKNFLLEQVQQSKSTVVMIEDAHELPNYVLNKLLTLCKCTTSDTMPLSIVLLGLPGLDAKLQQLNLQQRVQIRCRLDYLQDTEANAFIQHQDHQAVSAEIAEEAAWHCSLNGASTPPAANKPDKRPGRTGLWTGIAATLLFCAGAATYFSMPSAESKPLVTTVGPAPSTEAVTQVITAGSAAPKRDGIDQPPVPEEDAIAVPPPLADTPETADATAVSEPEISSKVTVPPVVASSLARQILALEELQELADTPATAHTTAFPVVEISSEAIALRVATPSPAQQTTALNEHREIAGETGSEPGAPRAPLVALTGIEKSKVRHQPANVFIEVHNSR